MGGPRARKRQEGTPLRRAVGRPKRGEQRDVVKIATSVPSSLVIALDNEAATTGITRAALMCELLAEAIERRWSA